MKFTVLQQDILPALQTVNRSVGVRASLPVLDNILISAEDHKLKLAATNLEIGVIKIIPVEVEIEGEITVPAKTLLDIVMGLGQGQISIESSGDNLIIQSGKFKAEVNGISAQEFPAIPVSIQDGATFKKQVFLSCTQVLFACATDEGRPVLTAVYTDVSEDKIDFVATDGFRLAHRQIESVKGQKPFKSLIPKKTFEEVLRIISEENAEEVNISTTENQNQIIFTIGNTIISSRLIEGQFPNWEKIIPLKITTRVFVNKDEIMKAIKLASVFARNEANVLNLTTAANAMSLKSGTKQLGSQENEIEAKIEGEAIEIAFNSKFLSDAVSSCPADQLMIEFSGPLSPALIKPVEVAGLEYIVMPVRLN